MKKRFNIGDKIFPTDFSFFTIKGDNNFRDTFYYKSDKIKEKLNRGIPLIVISEPYKRKQNKDYYFIDVKFENEEEIYTIVNSINIFKKYTDYIDFIYDCEECRQFGY